MSVAGSGFNSSCGGDSIKGNAGLSARGGKGSNLEYHGCLSVKGVVSPSKALTFAMDWSMSYSSKPKWVRQASKGSSINMYGRAVENYMPICLNI